MNTSSYAEEQEKLQKELEGGSEIKIDAPKDPEVNPEVYRDVEPMLFRGFLTISAEINEVPFVFKSLNHREFEMLALITGGLKASNRFYDLFLAYGVLMVDGQNVLTNREKLIPEISESFRDMPMVARKKIIRNLSEVNRRASNAVTLTEAYAMEGYSRFRWAQLHGLDLTMTAVTGFSGSERLGLNWAQLLWRALNRFQDISEVREQEWEHSKFVGSCMAGKGVSKVYQADTERRRKEREERLVRKERLIRHVLLGESLDDKKGAQGQKMIVANTVEELAGQLERDLRGEKDWHDQVVEAHEKHIRKEQQTRRDHLQEMAQDWEREYNGRQIVGGTEGDGLTNEEVQFRITRRRQLAAQSAAAMARNPELFDPKMDAFLDKWTMTERDVDHRVSETDRDPSTAIPVDTTERPRGTPFRGR